MDLAFMSGFHMGIEGSALATGIGYMVPAIYGTLFSCRERKGSCISHGQLGMLPC
ncbi:MAG: hypothetical protein ACLRL6_02825 [Clostridium sp.]